MPHKGHASFKNPRVLFGGEELAYARCEERLRCYEELRCEERPTGVEGTSILSRIHHRILHLHLFPQQHTAFHHYRYGFL